MLQVFLSDSQLTFSFVLVRNFSTYSWNVYQFVSLLAYRNRPNFEEFWKNPLDFHERPAIIRSIMKADGIET